jgi:cytolysin-activating lysine-acyltransferase
MDELAKFQGPYADGGLDGGPDAGSGPDGVTGDDGTVISADDVAGIACNGAGANGAATGMAPDIGVGGTASPASGPDTSPSTTPTDASAAPHNMFASAVWLMMASPRHRHLFLQDLQWRLIPPLILRQFRLFQKDGKPVALATWAMVSEEVAARLGGGDGTADPGEKPRTDLRLKPAEWRSGERAVLVDVVAPFGNVEAVRKFVREEVLHNG